MVWGRRYNQKGEKYTSVSANNILKNQYDAVVIGGGFYGCAIALELTTYFDRVALLEKEADLMQRASYVNQARIHQGYHYPRSILTALRSRVNFKRFVAEFSDCVYNDFDKYYAIGRVSSKVSAEQFRLFCQRIDAPVQAAPKSIRQLFNRDLIEDVFTVKEWAFDSVKLKLMMLDKLAPATVDVALNTQVVRLMTQANGMQLTCAQEQGDRKLQTRYVFNCTYSQINQILDASQLALIPLKHEYTEMALVQAPDPIRQMGITVMDGPFFSIMPFPARGLHSLSHVRYTPHHYWQDRMGDPYIDAHRYFQEVKPKSQHVHMIKDAQRYIPVLSECQYQDSIWEVKTVLPQSEVDDSRPILFRQSDQIPNFISIMGGKIDNIFDIRENLKSRFHQEDTNQ